MKKFEGPMLLGSKLQTPKLMQSEEREIEEPWRGKFLNSMNVQQNSIKYLEIHTIEGCDLEVAKKELIGKNIHHFGRSGGT